jgi:hypothetical protein
MCDDDSLSLPRVEHVMHRAQQVEPVRRRQRMAGEATEGHFMHLSNRGDLGNTRQQFTWAEALVVLDVEGRVKAILAERVDRATSGDECHPGEDGHPVTCRSLPRAIAEEYTLAQAETHPRR